MYLYSLECLRFHDLLNFISPFFLLFFLLYFIFLSLLPPPVLTTSPTQPHLRSLLLIRSAGRFGWYLIPSGTKGNPPGHPISPEPWLCSGCPRFPLPSSPLAVTGFILHSLALSSSMAGGRAWLCSSSPSPRHQWWILCHH